MIRKLLVVAGALVMLMASPAAAQYPPVVVTPSTVVAGGQVTISGVGCIGGSTVTISITTNGGPGIPIGSGHVNPDGTFTVVVTIPADTAPGVYTLLVSCGTLTRPAQITVEGAGTENSTTPAVVPGPLPRTGTNNIVPFLQGGLVLIVAGGLLVLATNKRRSTPDPTT